MMAVVQPSRHDDYGQTPHSLLPVECVEQFFHGVAAPKVNTIDFSLDGLHCVSSHDDDALRWVDVVSLQHRETVRFAAAIGGVQCAAFTSSSDRLWVCPRSPSDGHAYIYSVSSEALVAAVGVCLAGAAASHPGAEKRGTLQPNYRYGMGEGVITTVAQSRTSDVAALVNCYYNSVQIVHPLVSGPVAATPSAVGGPLRRVSWSPDGMLLAVAGADQTTVFDLRRLGAGPVVAIRPTDVFPQSCAAGQEHASWCEGASFGAGSSSLLMSSRMGETVLVSLADCRASSTAAPSQQMRRTKTHVFASFLHGVASRHFTPSREDITNHSSYHLRAAPLAGALATATTAAPAVAAQFVYPSRATSMVAQPGASLCAGRHLLLYEAIATDDAALRDQARFSAALGDSVPDRCGALRYVLQLRENDQPRAMAINHRFGIIAVGSKSATWFAVNTTR